MTDPSPEQPGALGRFMARAGMFLAAFAVFTCGWLAMKTDDWRKMALYTVLAIGAAMAAQAFSRHSRSP